MRIALLSDVHANLTALSAVLDAIEDVDEVWVMGDIVGYGPDPSETLAVLGERRAVLLAGNHDRAVATGDGLDRFNRDARDAARLHADWLSATERDLLAALPETLERHAFSLCHGSFRDPISEYVTSPAAAAASLDRVGTAYGCCGHTHLPVLFRSSSPALHEFHALRPTNDEPMSLAEGRALVNPGSVGQPRDGDSRAAYAILDVASETVRFCRVAYDIPATQRRMRARGLPEVLADRLAYGF